MLQALLAGIGVGLAVALPLGAVGLLVVRTGTERGLRGGLAAAAGVATADLLYAGLAATAGGVLAGAVVAVAGPLRVVAAAALLALATRGLVQAWRPPAALDTRAAPRRARRTWAAFLGITLLNPLTVVAFGAVVVALPPALLTGTAARTAFVVGVGAASMAWQAVLAALGAALGRRLGRRWQRTTAVVGNVAIAVLAVAALAA
jgi:threonine/homoserine/homoserine lactone efflux protein